MKLGKLEFKAEDFLDDEAQQRQDKFTKGWSKDTPKLSDPNPLAEWQRSYAARAANKLLAKRIKETGKVVFFSMQRGLLGPGGMCFNRHKNDTFKAITICIEEFLEDSNG